ncbi:hypothetical protein [uncultured Microbacterium sp.]|uniref:hypothetical protein n=1 Tax=uncultured Microbacterium sp. TaxID=191216 RepID=UPI00261EBEF5|nr:hypothetical protein [uncultured Microbacterium sp.]
MAGGLPGRLIRLRTAAPPFLRDAIDRALAVEHGPIAWAKEKALVRGDIPSAPAPLTTSAVRLLITPMNYAGQGREWARSAASADTEATNLAVRVGDSLRAPSQWTVPAAVFTASRAWRAQMRESLPLFSHVMIESFASPLGRGTGDVVREDIAWLTEQGVRVGLICHGTDVRRPKEHIGSHRHSPFAQLSPAELTAAERSAQTNVGIAADFDGPVFVSTPDLLSDVPWAAWLPVVVEPARWANARGVDAVVPVVLHAPSSGPVKGSAHVDSAAGALAETGVVRYRRLQRVPAERMPEEVGAADIVVDQLLLGGYGVAACEALAAGRVVVGNVDASVRETVRATTGMELPIVQADPDTLSDVLERLAADPGERTRVAGAGPLFVERVHAGAMTRRVLADYLATTA